MSESESILLTKSLGDPDPGRRAPRSAFSLPPILLRRAIVRLRAMSLVVLALVVVFWFGVNLAEGEIAYEFRVFQEWAPNVLIILASLAVYLLIRFSALAPPSLLVVGLAYEVAVSYGMALSQYWNIFARLEPWQINGDLVGASTVAMWMFAFTVLVPCRPRDALIALILSGSAVPITIGLLIRAGNAPALPADTFISTFVVTYVVVVVFAYATARIIYGLGREVRRAEQMGSYRLTERIGAGGMGEVWRASHKLLARPAAVKLIRSDVLGGAADTLLPRFEREAQVTASLQSPHTVELYDFGSAEDGSFYYVMELLDGIDLETLVKRHGPMPAERAVHVLRQACHSLGEAHRRDLLHRDVKPANLFLCERAFEHDVVKVLDFGLVKQLTGGEDEADLTRAGLGGIAGTPAYLAPEIATGGVAIDGRADIYGLGGVAFWLLTGRRVFEEKGAVAMILAHVNQPPTPPSRCSELPVPPELDALILGCLAKSPADRPASADELAARLGRITLPFPWTQERARAWWDGVQAE